YSCQADSLLDTRAGGIKYRNADRPSGLWNTTHGRVVDNLHFCGGLPACNPGSRFADFQLYAYPAAGYADFFFSDDDFYSSGRSLYVGRQYAGMGADPGSPQSGQLFY